MGVWVRWFRAMGNCVCVCSGFRASSVSITATPHQQGKRVIPKNVVLHLLSVNSDVWEVTNRLPWGSAT